LERRHKYLKIKRHFDNVV
jgi:hypothetical protein